MIAVQVVLTFLFVQALVYGQVSDTNVDLESNTNFDQASSSSQALSPNQAVSGPYYVHLLHHADPDAGQVYRNGSGDELREIVRSQFTASLEQTSRQEPSEFAIIFHGKIESGKTSIVNRLLSSNAADETRTPPGPATQQTIMHRLELGSITIHMIDTPGFGSHADNDQQLVIQQMHEARLMIESQGLPLCGLYFVINPTERDALAVGNNLQLIQSVYGAQAAVSIRFIINYCDDFALQGQEEIDAFTENLNLFYNNMFDVEPEKILFVSANDISEYGCIGQLIDDLCNVNSLRQIDISDNDAIDNLLSAIQQYSAILDTSSADIGICTPRLLETRNDAESSLINAKSKLETDTSTLKKSRDSLDALKQDAESLNADYEHAKGQRDQLYREAGLGNPPVEPSFDYDHFLRQSTDELNKRIKDLQHAETVINMDMDDYSVGLAANIEAAQKEAHKKHENFKSKLDAIRGPANKMCEIKQKLDKNSQNKQDLLAIIPGQEADYETSQKDEQTKQVAFDAAESEFKSASSLSTNCTHYINELQRRRLGALSLAFVERAEQTTEQAEQTTENAEQSTDEVDETAEEAESTPAMNQE